MTYEEIHNICTEGSCEAAALDELLPDVVFCGRFYAPIASA